MLFLLTNCLFNGNGLRILEKMNFYVNFVVWGVVVCLRCILITPEVFLVLFTNQQGPPADNKKKLMSI